jgi:hypothetical protein
MGLSVTFAPARVTVALAVAAGAILSILFVYGIRWLEYHELLDAGTIMATAVPRARVAIRDTIAARDLAKLISKSRSLSQIDQLLEEHAAAFRFAHMQIGSRHAQVQRSGDSVLSSPLLWKFEYPIFTEGDGPRDGDFEAMVLTIWSSVATRSSGRPASAERVAQVLGPAIAACTLHEVAAGEVRARSRRASGGYRAVSERGVATAIRPPREVDAIVG